MKIFKQFTSVRALFGVLLLAGVFFTLAPEAQAQTDRPLNPVLTLTGTDFGYDRSVYPDGRIWAARSNNKDVEILVPVFIDNRWYTYYYDNPSFRRYIVDPIKSFKFSVLYNKQVLEAIGYEVVNPSKFSSFDEPLAKNWTIDFNQETDNYYFNYLNPNIWNQIKDRDEEDQFGGRITLAGISQTQLQNTDDGTGQEIYKILLYLKFRVKIVDPETEDDLFFLSETPIYIDNREIRWNDFDITKEPAWKAFIDFDTNTPYETDYPEPNETTGLAGLINSGQQAQLQPYKPGVIWVNIFDNLPNYGFELTAQGGQGNPQTLTKVEDGHYRLNMPITVDSASINPPVASELVKVLNTVSRTRLDDVDIESDQDWLEFRTVQIAQNDIASCNNPTRYCYIPYLDNDILGSVNDPRGVATNPQGDLNLEIRANPANLSLDNPDDPEKAGVYRGFITFRSSNGLIDPVRLEVVFRLYRNPLEPVAGDNTQNPGGIYLDVRNSNNQSTSLVFGTGHRATDGVDNLYGEGIYSPAAAQTDNIFSARFYPPDESLAPNGLADLAPSIVNRRTSSRDIRNSNNNTRSIIYNVRFKAGCDACYPVVIEWDLRSFPAGAQAFIIDGENGKNFPPVNMRTATPVGGDPNRRSFTVLDKSVEEFFIEYTLPNTVRFVDENGDPIIKNGWNFLSLPVNPVNKDWKSVYPRAVNIPIFYSNNAWQQEQELRVGIGYFIKYNQFVDVEFTGTTISRISDVDVFRNDNTNPQLDRGAWNSVGSLSTPINVEEIRFNPKSITPDRFYTLKNGVYGYTPGQGYFTVSVMNPGYGYWIKTNANGFMDLRASKGANSDVVYSTEERFNILNSSTVVTIADSKESATNLYLSNVKNLDVNSFEMPPVPPMGLFDARFTSNTLLVNDETSAITLQGVEYPISMTFDNTNADYFVYDAASNALLGSVEKGKFGTIEISDSETNAFIIRKENVGNGDSSFEVYPNPLSTSSNVLFNIVENSNVNVVLYDNLGNEVMTIVDDFLSAGEYNYSINAANLTSGNYIAKIVAGNFTQVVKVNVVK